MNQEQTQTQEAFSLFVGGRYLNKNGMWTRVIVSIRGDYVHWIDELGSNTCTRDSFRRAVSGLAQDSPHPPAAKARSITKKETERMKTTLQIILDSLEEIQSSSNTHRGGFSVTVDGLTVNLHAWADETLFKLRPFWKHFQMPLKRIGRHRLAELNRHLSLVSCGIGLQAIALKERVDRQPDDERLKHASASLQRCQTAISDFMAHADSFFD